MAIYDLYGFLSDDMDGIKKLLEDSLGIQFETRDGDYQGGGYFQWGKMSGEHFVLKWNIDPFDGEPAEMDFPAYQIIFYVNDAALSGGLQARVKGIILLRHEDLV